jgi:hypothetical protein
VPNVAGTDPVVDRCTQIQLHDRITGTQPAKRRSSRKLCSPGCREKPAVDGNREPRDHRTEDPPRSCVLCQTDPRYTPLSHHRRFHRRRSNSTRCRSSRRTRSLAPQC